MVSIIREDTEKVVEHYEADIDLRTAMGLDPTEGCVRMSKGAAMKRALEPPYPNKDLIDLLKDLDSGTEICVIPMVDSSKNPAEVFFQMRIIPPKE